MMRTWVRMGRIILDRAEVATGAEAVTHAVLGNLEGVTDLDGDPVRRSPPPYRGVGDWFSMW
jgi:hypothetical protein